MKKILIVVDYQKDFVDPNGSLPVLNATVISSNIQKLIDSNSFEKIIYTMDTHIKKDYFKSEESDIFPDIHCEFETEGWDLFNINPRNINLQKSMIDNFKKGIKFVEKDSEVMFVKDKFDIWIGNPDFEKWFSNNINIDTKIYICGVATNYCVFDNAMGYIPRGYKNVNIVAEAVEGIKSFPNGEKDPSFSENQLTMIQSGITFINMEDI